MCEAHAARREAERGHLRWFGFGFGFGFELGLGFGFELGFGFGFELGLGFGFELGLGFGLGSGSGLGLGLGHEHLRCERRLRLPPATACRRGGGGRGTRGDQQLGAARARHTGHPHVHERGVKLVEPVEAACRLVRVRVGVGVGFRVRVGVRVSG